MAVIASQKAENYKHIILNNGKHDSVGGQPTVGYKIDIQQIAKGCGYKNVYLAENEEELEAAVKELDSCCGPALLEVRVKGGARKDLGRPTTTPVENKTALMKFLSK